MSKGTYSFTTPIYYVNAAPHLGTAYTTIAADTVARYQRMNGYDVAFVTGMDEHGQKVADTAAAKGMTPQDWCDSMEPAFRDAWDMLGITYTCLLYTSLGVRHLGRGVGGGCGAVVLRAVRRGEARSVAREV